MYPDLFANGILDEYLKGDGFDLNNSPYMNEQNMAKIKDLLHVALTDMATPFSGFFSPEKSKKDCPICSSNLVVKKELERRFQCDACGLNGRIDNSFEQYHLEIDDFVWELSQLDMQNQPELTARLSDNQKSVFAYYKEIIGGTAEFDAEKVLSELKAELDTIMAEKDVV